MTLTLPLSCNKHVTIISTNALTMTSPDGHDTMIWKCYFFKNKLIRLGDLKYQSCHRLPEYRWSDISEGICKCNSNDLLFNIKCAVHDLQIPNTVFLLQNHNKTSRMHPRSKFYIGIPLTTSQCGCQTGKTRV